MPAHFHRTELKYWVDAAFAREIEAFCRLEMVPDRGGTQRNVSIYLDSPAHELYRAHRARVPDRFKLRARRYGTAAEVVFLEIKRKIGAVTLKERCEVAARDVPALLARSWRQRPETDRPDILERFLFLCETITSEPKLVVSCDRHAFRSPNPLDESRLTIDSGIVYQPWREQHFDVDPRLDTRIDGPEVHGHSRGQVMLELKFAGTAPGWMSQLVFRFGLQRISFSKYCAAVEREFSGPAGAPDFHREPLRHPEQRLVPAARPMSA